MPKINIKGSRPKSKTDRLRERRNKTLVKNHFDVMQEQMQRKELFLDEGAGSSSDDEAPEEVTSRRPELPPSTDEKNEDELGADSENADDEDDPDLRGLDALSEGEDDEEEDFHDEDFYEDEEDLTTQKEFTDISGKRKVFHSDDEDEVVGDDGVLRFKTSEANYNVVVLDKALTSTFIKPRATRKELLRAATEPYRVKERQDYNHVKKCRRLV